MVQISDGFNVYLEYCDNYTKSEKLYTELMDTIPLFKDYVLGLNKNPLLRSLGWSDFLVKPIQRPPKYILLINDFIKHTESDNPMLETYQKAYGKFKNVVEDTNKNMGCIIYFYSSTGRKFKDI